MSSLIFYEFFQFCISIIFHTFYTDEFYTSLHIERWTRDTDIHSEYIGLGLHLESGYQLGTIVCCDEESSRGEWIECTSVSHLLDARYTPELAYHVKTRESKGLVDEEKHTIYRVLDRLPVEDARGILENVSTRICHSSRVIPLRIY